MTTALSPEQVCYLRTLAQRLDPGSSGTDVAQVVAAAGGLQAQDTPAGVLSVRPRSTGLTAADVERARSEERSIVRTWAMRGTLHFVPAADVHWLLALLGPIFIPGNARRRAQLGLDDATCAHAIAALRDVLAQRGQLTRAEIVTALAGRGIRLEGQARPHLLALATMQGVICGGPDRDSEPTYVLLDDWIAPSPPRPREAALAELARRHLAAFGPADAADFATWSGLPLRDARAGWDAIAAEMLPVEIAGRPAALLKRQADWLDLPPPAVPVVRLLPAFDTYLLGYRDRALILDPAHTRRVNTGGGIIYPTVLVDGRMVGTWRATRRKGQLEIAVAPFGDLDPAVAAGVAAEVADVGRFLGVPASMGGSEV